MIFEVPEENLAQIKGVSAWKKKVVVEIDDYHIPYTWLDRIEKKIKKAKECWVEQVSYNQIRIHYRINNSYGFYEINCMFVYQYIIKGKWKEGMLRH